jgi:hypothetical protein
LLEHARELARSVPDEGPLAAEVDALLDRAAHVGDS